MDKFDLTNIDFPKKSRLFKVIKRRPRKLTRDKSFTNLPTLETLEKQTDAEKEAVNIIKNDDTDVMLKLHRSVTNEVNKRYIKKLQRTFIPYDHQKLKTCSKTHRLRCLDPLIHDGDCIIESKFADLIHNKLFN